MKALRTLVVMWLVTVLGSCVVAPVADEPSRRSPAPPPPVERIDKPVARISDLEAVPVRFVPGRPIDFIVKISNSGGHGYDFDIGVFHEARLVGWTNRIEIPRGVSTFRLKDDQFTGEPGAYVVKLRQRGDTVDERRFSAWPTGDGRFTIDPGQVPRDGRRSPDDRHSPWDDRWVSIANLEAYPTLFLPRKPIDLVVKIVNKGSVSGSGFDVGILHEGRLVAWELDKKLNPGSNVFKVRDEGFTGDAGSYIVKVRRAGRSIEERAFQTYRIGLGGKAYYTLDPAKTPAEENWRHHGR